MAQVAGILIATGPESIGAEAPPTKAEQRVDVAFALVGGA
ncbi:hypothetical protein [Lysobacter enzymogenes]